MSEKQYLNQAAAARVYACSPRAIGVAMSNGKALYDATVEIKGRRHVDMHHAAAKAYRVEHRVSNPDVASRVVSEDHVEEEIRKYWGWTLEEIVRKCGTMARFSSLLQAADKIETIHAKRLDSDKRSGDLIDRIYVKNTIMGLVERVFQRLLSEMPVGLAMEIHGRCEAGATLEEVQQAIHDGVSGELRLVKDEVAKAVKNASN